MQPQRKLFNAIVGGVFALSIATPAVAELKLADVLASTQRHHPKIKAALAKQQQADLEKLSAEGEFDWQITQRTAGFDQISPAFAGQNWC